MEETNGIFFFFSDFREGLQEARVAALQGREEIRQENYRAPRRAAGRHRLLDVGAINVDQTPSLISSFLEDLHDENPGLAYSFSPL